MKMKMLRVTLTKKMRHTDSDCSQCIGVKVAYSVNTRYIFQYICVILYNYKAIVTVYCQVLSLIGPNWYARKSL